MMRNSEMPPATADAEEGQSEQLSSSPDPRAASDPSEAERRVAARQPLVHFVWFKIIEEDHAKTQDSLEGISKLADISETGVGLYVTTPLPVGKTVFIEIVTKKLSLSGIGKVAYARKAGKTYYRIGVHFTIVPPNDRLLLSRYLAAAEQEPRSAHPARRENRE